MPEVDAAEIAKQVSQQLSQQLGVSISDAISKLLQTSSVNAGETVMTGARNIEDIGGTERLEKDQMGESGRSNKESMDNSGLLFANEKRTYDEYQDTSLAIIRQNQAYINKVLSDAQSDDTTKRNIANQALQNAVETANMVGKQAVRHSDIAIDREWNVDEQGYTVTEILRDETFKDAIAAAVAKAVQDAVANINK